MPDLSIHLTSARLVSLGRNGVEIEAKGARSWDLELTFSTGDTRRLKARFKSRLLAVTSLGKILREFRAAGLDGRQVVRAECAERMPLRPAAKCLPVARQSLRLVGSK